MKLVDLFCGMGGVSCGAAMAGMEVALAVDAWAEALDTHEKNHPNCRHEIRTLPSDDLVLPEGDLHIHASPPCQMLSCAKDNATPKDKLRAVDMVRWACRFCRKYGTTWSLEEVASPYVKRLLEEEGVDYEVFDTSHFGVPQTRKRLLAGSPEILAHMRAIVARNDPPKTVRDVIPECRGTHIRNSSVRTWMTVDGKRELAVKTPEHFSFARSIDKPAYTVTTCPPRWWSEGSTKCLSFKPREMARIQSFPDEYVLPKNACMAHKQIGNAVPPLLFYHVAKAALATQK